MARLIAVDDDLAVAEMVADCLSSQGHEVRVAHGGSELRELLSREAADLVVLDLNMPGENGFSLARWLREAKGLGVLMLTAVDTVFDRVAGLEAGADDYLAKPFAPAELRARVGAILRRRPGGVAGRPVAPGLLPFGPHAFDPGTGVLLGADGAPIPLTAMEAELVAAFAAHPGRVLSRDDLLDLAPPRGEDPFDRSVDSRVARLRQRIEADPSRPQVIRTVRGAGYVLSRG